MTDQQGSQPSGLRLVPAPPADFDPFTATAQDLRRHGLPVRPDPQTQPSMAALWERQAERYRGFEHLDPRPDTTTAIRAVAAANGLGPDPIASCGYTLFSRSAPFTALFITWTVPNLTFTPGAGGPNQFHTFVGLGFLDVHVEMTVDATQNVTSHLWAQGVGQINLPVAPGDVISGSLCLDTAPPGTAHYFLANETRAQTVNFTVDTGFPPAVTIDAGVTRSGFPPPNPALSHFGVVYFDEISAFTTAGSVSLTGGNAITMVNLSGTTLARPVRL
ncbi:MAG: G1 family glutamic endopeptidase, partial [Actinoplanes sp.]